MQGTVGDVAGPMTKASSEAEVEVTIVVPILNERENIRPLYESVIAAMEDSGRRFEMICVDDGSSDGTAAELEAIAALDPRIKVVTFRRNYGQTAATMAGFDHAAGSIIVPMDGDLQNDPRDIMALLDKLEEGYDVVSGWRRDRQDHALRRNLPSRVANTLISRISGVHLHDYGCTLKAYRRDILEGVRLYGEMHRFVPIYAKWQGGRVCEIPVQHHPRRHGQSKYGLGRISRVLLDLVLIKFLADYQTRPIHIFGGFGLICFAISALSGLLAVYLRLFEHVSFILTPLPLLVVMTFITGVLCILLGLLAEILVRIYYESRGKTAYDVKSRRNLPGHG
jgi:glycosyltransferase involved in cell wall biosynthesis